MAFQQNQVANHTVDMTYRDQRNRTQWDISTDLESYADGSIVPFYRQYQSRDRRPNHDYSFQISTAVRTSNNIDLIESNPRAMDQIIWGMTHPNDCHPGVQSIVSNPALVDLLLIRHYKAHGGIALPPLRQARELQEAHELIAAQEATSGLTWTTGRTMMHYPKWQDVQYTPAPPGLGHGTAPPSRGRGGGNVGRGWLGRGGRGRGGRGRGV